MVPKPGFPRLLLGNPKRGVLKLKTPLALLPPITTLLIVLHIYLVRKHGVAPAPGDRGATRKFFPEQVFKDTVAIFVAFVILFMTAVVVKAPLGRLADPTDTSYIPRPDWYFLFLFQTLKLLKGSLEVIGSVVLPTLAVLALLLVPFIDQEVTKRLAQRTVAFGMVGVAAISWIGLTVAAIVTTPKTSATTEEELAAVQDWQQLSPEALAGIWYFREEQCSTCHNLAEGASKLGPELATTPVRRSAEWMMEHFKNPSQLVPGSAMPPIHRSDAQLSSLAAFLLKLTPKNAKVLDSAPTYAVEGAMIYQANRCGTCHTVNGEGMKVAPSLNGLSKRRTREWVEKQIRHPESHSAETLMPAFDLRQHEMDQLVSYLFSIPDIKSFSVARADSLRFVQ